VTEKRKKNVLECWHLVENFRDDDEEIVFSDQTLMMPDYFRNPFPLPGIIWLKKEVFERIETKSYVFPR
jgi:hypothetical protein